MFNIFDEISWPNYVKLPYVTKLPLNEQVIHYNQYLYQLSEARSNWITYQNKGPLTKEEEENFLLQEDGFYILQEDGSKIIIE